MQSSTACGSRPVSSSTRDRVEQVREQQPVDDEARRVRDLDGDLAERRAQRAGPRARVGVRGGGKTSSTRSIFGTGLNTCSPTKRPGRPVASASALTESAEVVRGEDRPVRRAAAEAAQQRRAWRHAPRRSPRPRTSRPAARRGRRRPTRCRRPRRPRFSIRRSTLAVAASGRRAHSTTCPCSAATQARPEAMAPPPAMPIRSDTVSISRLTDESTPTLISPTLSMRRFPESWIPVVKSSSSRPSARPIGRGHPEKGYYKDTHPNELLGTVLHGGDRARRDRAGRRRGRDRRLRPAVRRADVQRHAQRVAAGRAAGRDAGHDGRPPVRLGPAGGQLRRRADRRRRPRRRHRRRRRAHGPHPDGRSASSGSTTSARPTRRRSWSATTSSRRACRPR